MLNNIFRKSTYRALGSLFSVKNIFRSTMDGEESLLSSHEQLTNCIRKKGVAQQDLAIEEYLRNVKYPPVPDFEKGLEWFNVSEPLSFAKHLKGKVVLLDFFTYCCINCMHILPDLKDIENTFSVEDGLVVIGVHSAKFENEKLSKNILAAVQRYNIAHPVVNDNHSSMWKGCEVCCWPTLVLLGPNANPIVMLMGEGHREELQLYIKNALAYYKSRNEISNHTLPFKSAYHLLPDLKGPLLFPGKITSYIDQENNSEVLAISDTGNHRILIVENNGNVIHQVGGSRMGFKDGNLNEAQFNSPQGLVFQNPETLFIADTENHAIRKISLKNNSVTTIAGFGEQGRDYKGGKIGDSQEISSPWDVSLFRTSDFNSKENTLKDVLIIAMAGTHQIWAVFLDNIVWWKNQSYTAGTCMCIAGSGKEENKNNQYPHAAGFAQPSGLALNDKTKEVFIADSESSSIRKLSLIDGKVTAVVGGDLNPRNLFAFGDKDGKQYNAKLQHALGIATSKSNDVLFVADTYNHKIKQVDILTNTISTMNMPRCDPTSSFNEPAGLCISADGQKLYVADTNNHKIKILSFDNNYHVTDISPLNLKFSTQHNILKVDKTKLDIISGKPLSINSNGGKLVLNINMEFKNGLGLTTEAPQSWTVDLPNGSWSCVPSSGSNVLLFDVVFNAPPSDLENEVVDIIYKIVTCKGDICQPKTFVIRQPIHFVRDGAVSSSSILRVLLNESEIVLQ